MAKANANAIKDKTDRKFMDAWRALEQTLKNDGLTVQQFEQDLESRSRPDDASRLRICRQIRNFIVHDGAGFVFASDEMAGFVEAIDYEVQRAHGIVKDYMVSTARYGALKPDDLITAAGTLVLAKKHGDILVLSDANMLLGVFGPRAMSMALADGAARDKIQYVIDRGGLDTPKSILPWDHPSDKAPGLKSVVTDQKGRCIGVLNPERSWS